MKKTLLLFFILLGKAGSLVSQTENRDNRAYSNYLNIPGCYLYTHDDKFIGGISGYTNQANQAVVELGLNEDLHYPHPTAFTICASFDVILTNSLSVTSTLTSQNLILNFNPAELSRYKDKAQIVYPNMYKAKVYNIKINDCSTGINPCPPCYSVCLMPDVYLQASIETSRTYTLTYSATFGSGDLSDSLTTNDQLKITWPFMQGAASYELEYTFVDDYGASLASYAASSALTYDFERDATRISTHKNHYYIPLTYEHGYIVYRVRPVGQNALYQRIEGSWYPAAASGTVSAAVRKVAINPQFPSKLLTWQSTRTFAEQGKAGTGVEFADALGFPRQNLARLNSDSKTIAQSSLFDFYGRPLVQVLPAPVNEQHFKYRFGLNLYATPSSTVIFDKLLFDRSNTNSFCTPTSFSISPLAGTSNYFSPLNANKEAYQGYVPDAEGYPFTQIKYTNDGLSRISKQTLPGMVHKLSSSAGREIRRVYTEPEQVQLDRIFGSEAARCNYYQRTSTTDPNGQISIEIEDMYGRVAASFLKGLAPSNLDPASSNTNTVKLVETYDTAPTNISNSSTYCKEVNKSIEIYTANTDEVFMYKTTWGAAFTNSCDPSACFHCVYDVTLSIKDECDQEIFDYDHNIGTAAGFLGTVGRQAPYSSTISCSQATSQVITGVGLTNTVTITFPRAGKYKIYKKICVSDAPIADYTNTYLNISCPLDKCEILNDVLSEIDFSGCLPMSCNSCYTSINNYTAMAAASSTGTFTNQGPQNGGLWATNESHPGSSTEAVQIASLSPQQLSKAYENCSNYCSSDTRCSKYTKILESDFYPGTGQFAATSSTSATWSLSVFNPTNVLPGSPVWTLTSLSYSNAAGQSDYVSIDGVNKNPYELSQADFVANYRKSWAKAFMKYHPDQCKHYFYCTVVGTSLDYDEKIKDMQHSDQACSGGGYWFPVRSGSYSNYKPAGSCTVSTAGIDPVTQLSYTSNAAFATVINNFKNGLTGNFRNSGFDIYRFTAAQLNTLIATSSPPSYTIGQNPCTADEEWLHFKTLYLTSKEILYQDLLTVFLANPSNYGAGSLSCTTLPAGAVTHFPDRVTDLTAEFPTSGTLTTGSLYTIAISPPASGNATAIASYTDAMNQFTSDVVPSPTYAANQCSMTCNSYTLGWKNHLRATCPNFSTALAATQNSILAAMVEVCQLGCDYLTNLEGASSTPPGVSYTLPGTSQTVTSFQQVLDHYLPGSCNGIVLDGPDPYPSTGGTVTLNQLSSCKCDILLEVANDFATGTYTNFAYEWQLFEDRYGFDLADYNRLKCFCKSAVSGTWTPGYSWSPAETGALSNYTAGVDPSLICRSCLSCTDVVMAINAMTLPITSTYTSIFDKINLVPGNKIFVKNTLNSQFGLHLLQEYLNLYKDCSTFTSSAAPYTFSNTISSTGMDIFAFLKSTLSQENLVNTHVMTLCTDNQFYLSSLFSGTLPVIPGYTYTPVQNSNTLTLFISLNTTTLGSIRLVRPATYAGNWSDITDFTNFVAYCPPPQTSGPNFGFKVDATDNLSAVISLTGVVTGTAWPVSYLSYGSYTVPAICPQLPLPVKNSCVVNLLTTALVSAEHIYEEKREELAANFKTNWKQHCFSTLGESFTRELLGGDEYSFTLYYYDRAGNLQRTVPPNGSDPGILSSITSSINPGTTLYPAYSSTSAVALNFVNDYRYDSYNNLAQEKSVDGGQTVYYYDQVGRLMASQNAKQQAASNSTNVICSYSLYDDIGRIKETGQVHFASVGSWTNSTASNFEGSLGLNREEVTRIYYDRQVGASNTNSSSVLGAFTGSVQQNLRNRVSFVTYASVYTGTVGVYEHATYYSYDDHGNVSEVVQHNKKLDVFNKGLNTISYEFELISGNMIKASYQKNKADQFSHKYYYDADNRLKEVFTSKDGYNWDRDAKYFYYEHGPLARVERGDKKVQGSDYFYTIHGWIKAVNNDALVRSSDPGKDGTSSANYVNSYSNVNNWVAGDAMGYSLNYYNTSTTADYKPIKSFGSGDLNPLISVAALTVSSDPFYLDNNSANLAGDGPDLFNGNIGSMNTVFIDKDPTNTITNNTAFPQLTAYRYDQLQRLTKMKSFRSYSTSNYTWNPGNSTNYNDAYKMGLSYDNNGNILSLFRNGPGTVIVAGSSLNMDNLSYSYYNSSVTTATASGNYNLPYNSNRLRCVTDGVSSSNYSEDIDHVGCDSYDQLYTGTPYVYLAGTQRYGYDEIGNLVFDRGEHIIKIDWTVDRKVKRIWRDSTTMAGSGITKPDIIYEYNPQRQRVTKIVMPRHLATGTLTPSQNWMYTYYVYDASGNVMATYDRTAAQVSGNTYRDKLSLKENMIYGSERLAIALPASTLATWSYSFNAACGSTVNYCRNIPSPTTIVVPVTPTNSGFTLERNLGYKDFELTNHLGNVITVSSDRKFMEMGNTVMNDDFTSSLNGWNNATLNTGRAVVTTSLLYGAATKTFVTIPGQVYRVTYSTTVPSGAVIEAEVYTDPPVAGYFLVNKAAVAGTNQVIFMASSAQSLLRIQKANAPGTSITYSIDNVVVDQPSGYKADIVSNMDYYPGGQTMPGRTWVGSDKYRYSHNGHEREDELYTGAQSAEYWMYDSRILRRWEMDPVTFEYQSPYVAFDNNPIYYSDLLGAASGTGTPTGGGPKDTRTPAEIARDDANAKCHCDGYFINSEGNVQWNENYKMPESSPKGSGGSSSKNQTPNKSPKAAPRDNTQVNKSSLDTWRPPIPGALETSVWQDINRYFFNTAQYGSGTGGSGYSNGSSRYMDNQLNAIVEMLGNVKPASFDDWIKSTPRGVSPQSREQGPKKAKEFGQGELHKGDGTDPDEFKDPIFQNKPAIKVVPSKDTVIEVTNGKDTSYLKFDTKTYRKDKGATNPTEMKDGKNGKWQKLQ